MNLVDPLGLMPEVQSGIEEITVEGEDMSGSFFRNELNHMNTLRRLLDDLSAAAAGAAQMSFAQQLADFLRSLSVELGIGNTVPMIQCAGRARVFAGNPRHVGAPGGFSGSTVGDIKIESDSAAIIPTQFRAGKGRLRPFLDIISGATAGEQSFQNVRDVVGNADLGLPASQARIAIQFRNPGQFILELVTGRDESSNIRVELRVPRELGCPIGTREAR